MEVVAPRAKKSLSELRRPSGTDPVRLTREFFWRSARGTPSRLVSPPV
jgi:hypothetical protein